MPQFTPGELSVMRILWDCGELKPGEIQERFPEPIKNPALRSYLKILLDKGHVSRRMVGKAYFYKATTRQQTAFRSTLREILEAYCDGSAKSLIMNLIRNENLSEAELLELKRLADGNQAAQKGNKK